MADTDEVSLRALSPLFERWEREGRPIEEMLEGTLLDPTLIRRAGDWISWDQYTRICANADTRWTEADWERLGRESLHGPGHRIYSLVGWMLPDEASLLRWAAEHAYGVGGYSFRTLHVEVRPIEPTHVRVRVLSSGGRALPRGAAAAMRGALAELPTLLGQREGRVTMRQEGDLVEFDLHLQSRSRLRHRIASFVGFPWVALTAAREVKHLQERLTREREELATQGRRVAEAEADREALSRRLRKAETMEAVGRLAGGVAHDFNNLLTIILAHAELASMDASEAVAQDLEVVIETTRRAGELTEQLLAISRQQPTAVENVDVAKELRATESVLRGLLPVGVHLDLVENVGGAQVQMARASLSRILSNLVVNAGDALGDRGAVAVSAERVHEIPAIAGAGPRPGAWVRVRVEDDGPGMPPEIVSRVIEPFFTTKASGTGLGLATVYGLVTKHGGQLQIQSEPREGTRVDVYLPVIEDVESVEPANPAARRATRVGAAIWVADDEPYVREIIERALTEAGFRPRAFVTGTDLLEGLGETSRPPALVLADVVMPGLRGDELASLLREQHPEVPVILMSGYPSADLYASGPAVLAKPFTLARLIEVVRDALSIAAE